MNRTRSIAKQNMRIKGHTRNRPEEKLAAELIDRHMPKGTWWDLKTQYKVKDLQVVDYIDLTGDRAPRLDIALYLYDKKRVLAKKVAIRLMGPIHDESEHFDEIQKMVLEHPKNAWIVVDFWHWAMPRLWKLDKKDALLEIQAKLKHIVKLV